MRGSERLWVMVISIVIGAAIIGVLAVPPPPPSPQVTGTPQEIDSETREELERVRDAVARNYSLDTIQLPDEGCDRRQDVYNMMPVNASPWKWYDNPRPYRFQTNSEGWREPTEFSPHPPENTTRILILGDSYTFGTGLNGSDTYPVQFEQIINNGTERYQVINAGVQGSGIHDYCSMLEHRGLRYHPDIVVITFTYYDAIWRRDADAIYRQILDVLPYNSSTITESTMRHYGSEAKTRLYKEMTFNETAALPVFMRRIQSMATEAGARPIFYSFRAFDDHASRANPDTSIVQFMGNLTARHNMTWIRAPPVFAERPEEEYTLSDGHYDAWGDRQLAEHLAGRLRELGIIAG